MSTLNGKVAVATRGRRRGIAFALGEVGATVYAIGRSVWGESTTTNRLGTLNETTEAITVRGGVGIPMRCDRTVDASVKALFARVQQGQSLLPVSMTYEH